MKSLLVIGGSGFFGKSILDAFQRGILDRWNIGRIEILSRHATRLKIDTPELIDSRVILHDVDITRCSELPAADYVVHAAASTDASRYITNGEKEKANIQAGTYNYCKLASVFHRKAKIVYASSGAVYGVQPPDLEVISEDFGYGSIVGLSVEKRGYAVAKRDAEQAVMLLGRTEGLAVSIARCFAFVGPWLPRDQHFAIGNFIGDGISGAKIHVKARHRVYRSYMYADDLVVWLMTIADSASSVCPTYNVGSEQAVLMGDLAALVAGKCGVGVECPELSEMTIDRYVPSTRKARMELGLGIDYDVDRAVSRTIDIAKRTVNAHK